MLRRSLSNLLAKGPGTASYVFKDKVRVKVAGGAAGKGCVSFEGLGKGKKRADGGNGGDGGSLYIVADRNEQTLASLRTHHFKAESGLTGRSKKKDGRKGKDFHLRVPRGVIVKEIVEREVEECELGDDDNDDNYDDGEGGGDSELFPRRGRFERCMKTLADLNEHGSKVLVARGGLGGMGNANFVSSYGRKKNVHSLVSSAAAPKTEQDVRHLELELKCIADVGLVGFPNAGKSSLLGALSKARPTVASYPFTTLNPTIGRVLFDCGSKVLVADIPGLIEGASSGKGRGFSFLRHIERTNVLLYIVDGKGECGRCPKSDLEVLFKELESYGEGSLMQREAIVAFNKLDLFEDDQEKEDALAEIEELSVGLGLIKEDSNDKVLGISAKEGWGMAELASLLKVKVDQSKMARFNRFARADDPLANMPTPLRF